MTIWVTADQHFGHENIIGFCDRPYRHGDGRPDVGRMDRDMMERWNAVVAQDDIVFHLGDFAFKSQDSGRGLLARLHGTKHLIKGNHDPKQDIPGWASVSHYHEMDISKRRVVMCHYPMESWNKSTHNSVMLHGHCHATMRIMRNRLDVGVDSVGFTPITLEDAIERALKNP